MNVQTQFYTKLYSSSKAKLDTPDAAIFIENPNLSMLSSEAREKCEGKITNKECQNIIKRFQLGKTSGNDGLPMEFYNVVWSSISEMVYLFLVYLINLFIYNFKYLLLCYRVFASH